MKKRIALFANGWSSDFLQDLGRGMTEPAEKGNADIYAFINYSRHSITEENQTGEFSIYSLPDLSDFDGAVLLANTFNLKKELDYIQQEILRVGIPVVSLEYRLDGAEYLGSDDYSGMYELTDHLIKEHGVKEILFIGGMEDHAESNLRKKAVADALSDNGMELAPENITYGNFAAGVAIDKLLEWTEENKRLPDAVMCANDIMAVGVCNTLVEMGYDIPEDIIVTGFDALPNAREYNPPITSIARDWVGMGRICMDILLGRIEGRYVEYSEEIPTKVFYGGTCGCREEQNPNSSKKQNMSNRFRKSDSFAYDRHFRHMYLAMRQSDTVECLNKSLSDFFKEEGWLEGDDVMLAYHSNFFISENWDNIRLDDYDGDVNIVCHVHEGEASPVVSSNISDAIFGISHDDNSPQIYIFTPIRVEDLCVGFAALSSGLGILDEAILYRWNRHMSQYTELVKSNIHIKRLTKRLESLSVTDALTGVYNRTGCESIMYPALIANQEMNGRSVVMIADVDRLKYINDTFGHGSGDLAIKLTAQALQNVLPEGYMIGRYGGDEFLIVGCETDMIDTESIVRAVDEYMMNIKDSNNLNFELAVSVGIVQLDKCEQPDVVECIKKADINMYRVKAIHRNKAN